MKTKPTGLKPKSPPPAAYQSPLWLHLDEIRAWRRDRMSWRAISEKLKAEHKIDLTLQAVRAFFKSASKRKTLPLGFEPEHPQSAPAQPAKVIHARIEEAPGNPFSVDTEEELFGINKPQGS